MLTQFGTLIYNRILHTVSQENTEKNNEFTEKNVMERKNILLVVFLFFFFSQ